MPAMSGGSKFVAALEFINKRVKQGAVVNVGFPKGATERDDTSSAFVAAMNEWGSANRPPRPFMRRMADAGKKVWGKELGFALKATNYDGPAALEIMGQRMEGEMKQSIRDFIDPPLAASTIKWKLAHGFTDKPLEMNKDMLHNVTHWVIKR